MPAFGRLDTVTNGRYQELEFNGSFSAMNRKSGRSTPDPKATFGVQLTDRRVTGRVEMWRGSVRFELSVSVPFV
jgi:hypothetical protein